MPPPPCEAGAAARVDADPDGAPARPAAHAIDLRQEVDVQMDLRMRQDHIEVAIGEVRAGVADLVLAPPVLERPLHLTRRAHVHPHALGRARLTQRADEPQELGLVLGLQGEADPAVQPRSDRTPSGARGPVRPRERQIVHVERGAVLASDRLGVTTGDEQATAPDVESGAGPPRA